MRFFKKQAIKVAFNTNGSHRLLADFDRRIQWQGTDVTFFANTSLTKNIAPFERESEEKGKFRNLARDLIAELMLSRHCVEALKIKPYGIEIVHSRAISNAQLRETIERVVRIIEVEASAA